MGFDLFLVYLILIPLLFDLSFDLLYHLNRSIVWVCIVFLYLSERLYQQDYEDGSLEWYWLSRWSFQFVVCVKLVFFWLSGCVGIVCLFPLISILYDLPIVCVNVVCGSLSLALVVGLCSCFTCGSASWAGLQHLLTLPLVLPIVLVWKTPLALLSLSVFFACVFWLCVLRTMESLLSN